MDDCVNLTLATNSSSFLPLGVVSNVSLRFVATIGEGRELTFNNVRCLASTSLRELGDILFQVRESSL